MFWTGNKGKDKPDHKSQVDQITSEEKNTKPSVQPESKAAVEPVPTHTMSREELLASDPKAREMYAKLRSLRSSVDAIKAKEQQMAASQPSSAPKAAPVQAAPKAAPAAKPAPAPATKPAPAKLAPQAAAAKPATPAKPVAKPAAPAKPAAKPAAPVAPTPQPSKAQAEIAKQQQIEMARKQALEMKQQAQEAELVKLKENLAKTQQEAKETSQEQQQILLAELEETKELRKKLVEENETKRRRAEAKQKAEEARLKEAKRRQVAEAAAKKRAQELARRQAEAVRKAEEARIKDEKRQEAIKLSAQKKLEEARIKEERKAKARALWKEREAKRQEERRIKRQEKLKAAQEELKIHQEIERYRREKREEDEKSRLQRIREQDAAQGGGLVTVHDVTIKTEINKRENINLWDLLGLKTKAERNAKTDEERRALRLEREYRREDARAKFSFNRMVRLKTWQNSTAGQTFVKIGQYCDEHKKGIITIASAMATVFVFGAGAFNYCTAYEYSYNGTPLGVVNNKTDVLAVTGLVQNAVSEDNNMDVVIRDDDITFERVSTLDNVDIDTTEDVLNRLTYMSDYKIASYGIYVDNVKVGAVESADEAKNVLQSLKDMYASNYEKSTIEEAVFLESVEVKECNTKLGSIKTVDEMVNYLTTDVEKETIHNALAGETVEYIASEYNTTSQKVIEDNPLLKEEGTVAAGTAVVIKASSPLVTVLIREKVEYKETIAYEVEETKDDQMYKGDEEVTQEGVNGSQEVKAVITTANGKTIKEDNVETVVTKQPVTKKVTVGTKKRPPTVGDGKFMCPIQDKFHQTTGFRMRWGRFHKGLDLACPTGTEVHASDGGTVITASYQPSYGNLVVIDHQNGYTTKYAHNSKILCNVGDKVYEGQVIALVGSTGNSTGPHCHFEIRYNDEPKNPLNYITYPTFD